MKKTEHYQESINSNSLSVNVILYISKALDTKKKQRLLYLLIFLLLFSAIFDDIKNPTLALFNTLLMVLSASGLSIYLGLLLRYAVPSHVLGYFKYRLIGIAWILSGIGFIIGYVVLKIISLYG